ncbi:MAG TPA: hypothetical protein VFP86_09550 [bacterium]|nr:hypothetical protein [bacterium]
MRTCGRRWTALRGTITRSPAEVEPVRVRSLALRTGLGVVAPQVLYYSGLALGLPVEAIVAAVTWTLAVAVFNWRRSFLNPFMLYAVAVTAGQGAVALLAGNPVMFAGSSVVENLLDGVGFLGSIAVGRPLLAVAMKTLSRLREDGVVFPAATRSALRHLTLLWALGFLLRGGALYAALISLPLGWFLVVNSLAGWPVTGLGVVASLAYLRGRQRGSRQGGGYDGRVAGPPLRPRPPERRSCNVRGLLRGLHGRETTIRARQWTVIAIAVAVCGTLVAESGLAGGPFATAASWSNTQRLLVSNSPETVAFSTLLFSATLSTAEAVRLVYHHQNGATARRMMVTVALSNPTSKRAAVWVTGGEPNAGADELVIGHAAARDFLMQYWRHEAFLFSIPAHTTSPLVVHALAPGEIASGLMQVAPVEDAALGLQVIARMEGDLDPPTGSDYLPLPDRLHQRGAFEQPEVERVRDYVVGGPFAMMALGGEQDLVRERATGDALQGNYGVIYTFQIRIHNATPMPATVTLVMHAVAGQAGGMFRIDERIVDVPRVPAGGVLPVAMVRVAPSENRLLVVSTMPESGANYPVLLTLGLEQLMPSVGGPRPRGTEGDAISPTQHTCRSCVCRGFPSAAGDCGDPARRLHDR